MPLLLYLYYPADPQPKDSILYYGFSSFAMEMNELTPELEPFLPLTDTRLRPDQRWVYKHRAESLAELPTWFFKKLLHNRIALFGWFCANVARLLEEGKVEEADKKKDDVEETQREQRKILAKRGEQHIPRFFR